MKNLLPSNRRPDENPFRSSIIDRIRFRPQGSTWDELFQKLEGLGWRAAIIGPEGSGKTALLDDLAERSGLHASRVELHGGEAGPLIAAVQQLSPAIGENDVVFFDGAEQLGPIGWWRFSRLTRGTGGLVITSHRSGRLPTLIECRTSPTLLRELVAELVPQDVESLGPHLNDLFRRNDGNIRSCFRKLYDRYAGRKS